MTATGHAILGTVIAAKIGNPALAIPLALLSHIAADAFPHWDTATNFLKKSKGRLFSDSVIDVLISLVVPIVLVATLFQGTSILYTYLIVFMAQLFDWATAPYYFFNINLPPFTWAYDFQKLFDNRLDKPWGIINQVSILLLILLLARIY